MTNCIQDTIVDIKPIMLFTFEDEGFDSVTYDVSDRDYLLITQTDEMGVNHEIMMSANQALKIAKVLMALPLNQYYKENNILHDNQTNRALRSDDGVGEVGSCSAP
jgi:hypothetical protein